MLPISDRVFRDAAVLTASVLQTSGSKVDERTHPHHVLPRGTLGSFIHEQPLRL